MTTALDTNVIVALWDRNSAVSIPAQTALDQALHRGGLVVSAVVFAELMAAPGRTEAFLNAFFKDTAIKVEFDLDEPVWRAAGRAFQAYAARRRKQREPGPRRILADFLIGAHATQRGYQLLTLDESMYRTAFAGLSLITA
ncbi:MAG TPA: type II toxin-antitoxin system VapC family toxin [Candidatus Angelobacter sp.]|nr:type II toxin-antitoxin system VapC family toxin [Candidatus Angelobacter sp.]